MAYGEGVSMCQHFVCLLVYRFITRLSGILTRRAVSLAMAEERNQFFYDSK